VTALESLGASKSAEGASRPDDRLVDDATPLPPRRPKSFRHTPRPPKRPADLGNVPPQSSPTPADASTAADARPAWPIDPAPPNNDQPRGIDVSFRNGPVDWAQLKKAGIKFAFIKASDGATFSDPAFQDLWKGASDAGIARAAYHFFRPKRPVKEQVDNFIKAYKSGKDAQLPPILDVESPHKSLFKGMTAEESVAKVAAWLGSVEKITGQHPMIYTNSNTLKDVLDNDKDGKLAGYPLWLSQPPPSERATPKPFEKRTFWQYNIHGSLPGIDGDVDLDVFNGSSIEYRSFLRSMDTKNPSHPVWDR